MSGVIRASFGSIVGTSTEIAMVKQTLINMKQPDLGQKILELRKAKGMTQEELVELCNINVRTIQRIEAGEVTPRSFTIKSILDALGYDFNTIQFESDERADDRPDVKQIAPYLKVSFIVGIAYFLIGFVETAMDFAAWDDDNFSSEVFSTWYVVIKVAAMLTFIVFIFGFYKLSVVQPNSLLRVGSILLMIGIVIAVATDIYGYYSNETLLIATQVGKSIVFGGMLIVFSFGLVGYQKIYGPLALIAGVLGSIAGFTLLTVILAIPGLVLLAVFELLLLVLLFQSFDTPGHKAPSYGAGSLQSLA